MKIVRELLEGQPVDFEEAALSCFHYQLENNALYRQWCQGIGRTKPKSLSEIPFLPVELFRNHTVVSAPPPYQLSFMSSGTTSTARSRHFVKSTDWYKKSFLTTFMHFYGSPARYRLICLLPSYAPESSLIYMCSELIRASKHPDSGFYLEDPERMHEILHKEDNQRTTLLLGVTHALLDLAEQTTLNHEHLIVMETGGMKGRRKEMVRAEVHRILQQAFGVAAVHSEYGMTELLSQAYSSGMGLFTCPPWMKVISRDAEDPFELLESGQRGLLNIIDLANIDSCCFIATQDTGLVHSDGRFEVTGRSDNSDIRGCNLLLQ
ncbi:MAG TPA: acyl transferase [Bacteroidetes bacterium]|nr:MAG: hypothetical protein ABR94_12765 [Sphingobacteriales bacterium BACL12 MAG-120802-bin5]KRP07888.1 MAG: hypothetical protein ABR95_05740 [Sphingobacteriales bacterium BACL12 MAG-120813-bin55]HCK23157.1 acyl transferase [Bacteroidota bacterium]